MGNLFEKQEAAAKAEKDEWAEAVNDIFGLLLKMGMNKKIVEPLLSVGGEAMNIQHHKFLEGPVVVHNSQWNETLPEWILKLIPAERWEIIATERKNDATGWKVGPCEIVAVMYGRVMDAPMPYQFADLYVWASSHAKAKHDGVPVETIYEKTGLEIIKDEDVLEPGGRLHYDYKNLCMEIRRKVIRNANVDRRKMKQTFKQPKSAPVKEAVRVQLSMF